MATASKKSHYCSEYWRRLGNEKFKAAHAEGINCQTLVDRMKDAICNYQKAYSSAEDDVEMASASRNLGVAKWKMVSLQKCTGVKMEQMHFFYKEGITHLSKAHTLGERCKNRLWQAAVGRQLLDAIDEAYEFFETLPYRQRLPPYEQYVNCLSDGPHKSRCYLKLANVIFMEGVTALQDGAYKTTLNNMKECYRPIEEAKRLAGDDATLLQEAGVLQDDCFLQTCSAESIQARVIGDEIFQKALLDEERILMTGIYDALDWYKKAIIVTMESDIEMEAIAHSRIGVVYDKVIKIKHKAHDYFRRAIDLAMTMQPRHFGTQDWFKEATSALQRYQDEVRKQEDESWNKQREKYVTELKDELQALEEESSKGYAALLRYVYRTYPPKKRTHKLDIEKLASKENKKPLLKKSLIHYHPDKQKEHGEKWVVICEEVYKLLSNEYECTKGEC